MRRMSFFRRSRQFMAGLLFAVALFSQTALAVAACLAADRCPTMAFAAEPCPHGAQTGAMNGNLCLAHATASDQSFDGIAATPAIPPAALTAGLVVPVAIVVVRDFSAGDEDCLVAASPSIPIRYCTFRN